MDFTPKDHNSSTETACEVSMKVGKENTEPCKGRLEEDMNFDNVGVSSHFKSEIDCVRESHLVKLSADARILLENEDTNPAGSSLSSTMSESEERATVTNPDHLVTLVHCKSASEPVVEEDKHSPSVRIEEEDNTKTGKRDAMIDMNCIPDSNLAHNSTEARVDGEIHVSSDTAPVSESDESDSKAVSSLYHLEGHVLNEKLNFESTAEEGHYSCPMSIVDDSTKEAEMDDTRPIEHISKEATGFADNNFDIVMKAETDISCAQELDIASCTVARLHAKMKINPVASVWGAGEGIVERNSGAVSNSCDLTNDVLDMKPISASPMDCSNGYRSVVPYSDTDDSESSSSSSSTVSSSESSDSEYSSGSSDLEDLEVLDDCVKVKSGGKKKSNLPSPIKVHGELDIDDLPPIENLHISVPCEQVKEIGKVLHCVETLVVVESYKDLPPLDVESVLFLDKGARALGRIFDVIGPVKEPLYCVRFNSQEHIESQNVKPGMPVYCAPKTEHSHFVFVKKLMMMKGSDASWKQDAEIPSNLRDFSDDEEETSNRARICEVVIEDSSIASPKSKQPKKEHAHNNTNLGHAQPARNFRGNARENFRPRIPRHHPHPMNSPGAPQWSPNEFGNRYPPQFNWGDSHNHDFRGAARQPPPPTAIFGQQSNPGTFSQLPPNSSHNDAPNWCRNGQPYAPDPYPAAISRGAPGARGQPSHNFEHSQIQPPPTNIRWPSVEGASNQWSQENHPRFQFPPYRSGPSSGPFDSPSRRQQATSSRLWPHTHHARGQNMYHHNQYN